MILLGFLSPFFILLLSSFLLSCFPAFFLLPSFRQLPRVVAPEEFSEQIGKPQHQLKFSLEKAVYPSRVPALSQAATSPDGEQVVGVLDHLASELERWLSDVVPVHRGTSVGTTVNSITIRSIAIRLREPTTESSPPILETTWSYTVSPSLSFFQRDSLKSLMPFFSFLQKSLRLSVILPGRGPRHESALHSRQLL